MLGQDRYSCGATWLGILRYPPQRILTYADPFHVGSIRLAYSEKPFLFALESPFSSAHVTGFHHAPALCKHATEHTYSFSSVYTNLKHNTYGCQALCIG